MSNLIEQEVSPGSQLAPEYSDVDENYRAPYIEVPRDIFGSQQVGVISRILPPGFQMGEDKLRFRFISLPTDEIERQKRVNVIRELGSDRSNPKHQRHRAFYELSSKGWEGERSTALFFR